MLLIYLCCFSPLKKSDGTLSKGCTWVYFLSCSYLLTGENIQRTLAMCFTTEKITIDHDPSMTLKQYGKHYIFNWSYSHTISHMSLKTVNLYTSITH